MPPQQGVAVLIQVKLMQLVQHLPQLLRATTVQRPKIVGVEVRARVQAPTIMHQQPWSTVIWIQSDWVPDCPSRHRQWATFSLQTRLVSCLKCSTLKRSTWSITTISELWPACTRNSSTPIINSWPNFSLRNNAATTSYGQKRKAWSYLEWSNNLVWIHNQLQKRRQRRQSQSPQSIIRLLQFKKKKQKMPKQWPIKMMMM